ncbi:unnamed protein product [Linum tenue]|uniref:Uncharacterized protein n=1 Tax=Linum tenue TaxID=586396 RepID=A0AAV0LDS0_9ROSI|nr:unnamed protein product [Linum tenue]
MSESSRREIPSSRSNKLPNRPPSSPPASRTSPWFLEQHRSFGTPPQRPIPSRTSPLQLHAIQSSGNRKGTRHVHVL